MKAHDDARYIFRYVGYCVFIGLAIILVNFLVDPFAIHTEIASNRPEFRKQVYMAKANAIRRVRPNAVVLGASRALAGLDPQHACWPVRPVYNLGLEGPSMYAIRRYFEHVLAVSSPRFVVLALDFFSFNQFYGGNTEFRGSRLSTEADSWLATWGYWHDYFYSTFTLDATLASAKTLFFEKQEAVYREDGLRVKGWHKPPRGNNHSNMQVIFEGSLLRMAELALLPAPERRYEFSPSSVDGHPSAEYIRILDLADKHNVELQLFISPVHAEMLELYHALGLWQQFEQWKRWLVSTNVRFADTRGASVFSIVDFTGYNRITTEFVPGAYAPSQQMRWFFDASHYNRHTGNLVLNRVLNCGSTTNSDQKEFGMELDAETVDALLDQIRNDAEHYRNVHRPNYEMRRLRKFIEASNGS